MYSVVLGQIVGPTWLNRLALPSRMEATMTKRDEQVEKLLERIAALEARLASAESRLATVEMRPIMQTPDVPYKNPFLPQRPWSESTIVG